MDTNSPSDQKAREEILGKAGIDAKNQHIAVNTLHNIQEAVQGKIDDIAVQYLRRWERELPKNPKHFLKWMKEHQAIFCACRKRTEKLTGWHFVTFVYLREPKTKRSMEVQFRLQPFGDKGQVKLEIEHQEIAFPLDVKIDLKGERK